MVYKVNNCLFHLSPRPPKGGVQLPVSLIDFVISVRNNKVVATQAAVFRRSFFLEEPLSRKMPRGRPRRRQTRDSPAFVFASTV